LSAEQVLLLELFLRTAQEQTDFATQAAELLRSFRALCPYAELLIRKQGQALINKGKADGIQAETVYDVVKRGRAQTANEGIALVYSGDELVGKLTISNIDEEIAIGTLQRNGFFDRIEPGDEIILNANRTEKPAAESAANPELRSLLRSLR